MTYISGLHDLIELKKQHPEYRTVLHSDQGSVYASKNYNDDISNESILLGTDLYVSLYLSDAFCMDIVSVCL